MCSRYTIIGTRILRERFGEPVIHPRYNAAPGQRLPIITLEEQLAEAAFGIVRGGGGRRINARIEDMEERARGREERCAIPASGFYEWKTEGSHRQPYYISFPERELLAFAGIYDRERAAFCIVTKAAVEPMSRIHPRMPYVLTETGEKEWLMGMTPCPSDESIGIYPVSGTINNPTAPDDPSLIRRPEQHEWW
jgi:putative SOS response-associated peptidase YedK